MNINDAIAQIDRSKPNTVDRADKIAWLDRLDRMAIIEVFGTHEGAEEYEDFAGYGPETDGDTVLLIPAPFDAVYISWMESQIDYRQAEYDRYGNSAAMFSSQYAAFADFWNRTHEPNGGTMKFIP